MIGEQIFSTAELFHVKQIPARDLLQPLGLGSLYHQVVPGLAVPYPPKSRVVDKHVLRCVRRVRSVVQIVHPPVQQICPPVRVEENRRERVILVVHNQLDRRRRQQRFRQRPRRHVRVEYHQRHPRRVEKQHHHRHQRRRSLPSKPPPRAPGTHRERRACHCQRPPQVCEGCQRQIRHVSQRQRVHIRIRTQRRRNVPRRRQVPHRPQNPADRRQGQRRHDANRSPPPLQPPVPARHRASQQQRQRRITGHRVVLLRRRKREEGQDESRPAQTQ